MGLKSAYLLFVESKYPEISLFVYIWFQINRTFYECWVLFSVQRFIIINSEQCAVVDVIATSVWFNNLSINANHSSIEIEINFDKSNFIFFEVLCKIKVRKEFAPMADTICFSIDEWTIEQLNNWKLRKCPLKHIYSKWIFFLKLKKQTHQYQTHGLRGVKVKYEFGNLNKTESFGCIYFELYHFFFASSFSFGVFCIVISFGFAWR